MFVQTKKFNLQVRPWPADNDRITCVQMTHKDNANGSSQNDVFVWSFIIRVLHS